VTTLFLRRRARRYGAPGVFTSLNLDEGIQMVDAARASGGTLTVGTMKRYDPAYERRLELALPTPTRRRAVAPAGHCWTTWCTS
jgi:hypothetical protein